MRQHALQRPERPGDDLGAAALQQLLDRRPVLGAHVGAERRRHLARVEQQLRGPAVPVARGGRPEVLGQLQLEVVEQHLVVAELVAVVRCGREQPALLQLLQHGLAADGVEQRVAQRAGQHAERARAAQELAQLGGQVAEHLADEVGAHQPRPAGQVGQRPAPLRRWAALGEQVEHREPGRPPGGALRQRRGVLGRQRLVVDLAEQPLDLPRAEPQVVGVDDVHRAVDPQRRHVQPDDPARAEHHPQRRRARARSSAPGPCSAAEPATAWKSSNTSSMSRPAASSAAATSSNDRHAAPARPTRPSARPIRPASSPGSRSAASIRYQTTVPANRDAICPSSVVLPCPAGASTSTTRCAARSSRRLRASPAGAGGANFAERSSRPSPTLHPAPRSRGARPARHACSGRPTRRTRRHGTASERSAWRARRRHEVTPGSTHMCVRRSRSRRRRGSDVVGSGAAVPLRVRRLDPARRTPPRLVVCRHPGSSPPTSTARCSTPTTGSPLGPPPSSTGWSRPASSSCWSRAGRRAGSRRSSRSCPSPGSRSARTAPCSTTPSTTACSGRAPSSAGHPRRARRGHRARCCPAAGWRSSGSGRAPTTRRSRSSSPSRTTCTPGRTRTTRPSSGAELLDRAGDQDAGPGAGPVQRRDGGGAHPGRRAPRRPHVLPPARPRGDVAARRDEGDGARRGRA